MRLGRELLQLQTVDAGRVAALDVQKDVVVVEDVPDLDPEGLGVAEGAEGDAVDRDEGQNGVAPVSVQDGVDTLEAEDEFIPVRIGVEAIHPQGVPVLLVEDGHTAFESKQVFVGDGDVHGPVMGIQIPL